MAGDDLLDQVISDLTSGVQLSHADLANMRNTELPPEVQQKLALNEHRAFAREWTKENPLLAAPSLAFAIPAYTLAKATGAIKKTRSPASLDEIIAGYQGIWEGLTSK